MLDDAIKKNIPLVTDRPTIIFGADVTHPQPGEDSSPSIAAVCSPRLIFYYEFSFLCNLTLVMPGCCLNGLARGNEVQRHCFSTSSP